ncbi:MAG: yjmD [Mucilaginibacter sp.]|nr:yjmD [Mucilaginibacter sp.]
MDTLETVKAGNKPLEENELIKNMKALVYHRPGRKSWEEKPKPTIIKPTDAAVKIFKTTICKTDLHIMKGDATEVTHQTIAND